MFLVKFEQIVVVRWEERREKDGFHRGTENSIFCVGWLCSLV